MTASDSQFISGVNTGQVSTASEFTVEIVTGVIFVTQQIIKLCEP